MSEVNDSRRYAEKCGGGKPEKFVKIVLDQAAVLEWNNRR